MQQGDDKDRAKTLIKAIPIGSRGNTLSGAQFQKSYNVGDIVLYARETSGETNTLLGFILDVVTTQLTDVNSEETRVAATVWDNGNINSTILPLFDQFQQASGNIRIPSNVGHTGIDMLPGNYEMVGKLVAFHFSDYYAALDATCAEIAVNGIERRIVLQSMLRTESTVNELSDISILNQSTINTHKWCGNVQSAWYDCLKEDKEQITSIEDAEPKYRLIEQSGDILYGKHTTLLDQSGETPLYTDYLGLDGTRKILSASRVIIGKYPGVVSTEYVGKRLAVEQHEGEEPTPEDPSNSLKNLNADDTENWAVHVNTDFIENGGYPEDFLDADEGEYPDFKSIEVQDDLRDGKKIKLFPGNNYIEFQEDGGIKITDAWGSFILLSHGNIELHAINNMFAISGRDTLCFAGGNRTDFAKQNIAAQAFKGSYKVAAKEALQLCSEANLSVEARKTLYITARDSEVTSFNVTVRCTDPLEPEAMASGNFQVVSEQGSIDFIGKQFRSNALYISLTSDKLNQAFVLGGSSPLVVGSLDVRGSIWSRGESISLALPRLDTEGKLANKVFTAPNVTNWVNWGGNIAAPSGNMAAKEGIYTPGHVCGGLVCDTRWTPKKYVGNVSKFALDVALLYTPSSNKVSAKDISVKAELDVEDYEFSFNVDTEATTVYRLVNPLPTRNASSDTYDGFEALSGNTSFIYPGEAFWTVDGVSDFTNMEETDEPETYGFSEIPTANTK